MPSREVELLERIAELLVEIRDRLPEPGGCEDCAPGPIPHPDEIEAAVRARPEKLRREIEATLDQRPECARCGHPRAAHIEHSVGPLRCERCMCALYQGVPDRSELVRGAAAASSFPICEGPCKHAYCAEKKRTQGAGAWSPGGYPPASACAICSKLNVPWCQCRKPEPHPESPF